MEVPHLERFGIYALDLATEEVELITSSAENFAFLRLNTTGDRFIFTRQIDDEGGIPDSLDEEICSIGIDGENFERITNNDFWDLYPAASPSDSAFVFLSSRQEPLNLDLYLVGSDGSNERLFFDSGTHDADVHWRKELITFTSDNRIWTINADGSDPAPLTDPPQAGEWGNAPYPYGDFDPRLSPDATKVAFSRLVDAANPNGSYDIFLIDITGANETSLTTNGIDGYTQGLASWSQAGDRIVFEVAAISGTGTFDIWMIDVNGNNLRNITPDYFPANFLCHSPLFSFNDSIIFFTGEWWE